MIDLDDAIDRLSCMANEIVIGSQHEELKQSLEKDREVLLAMVRMLHGLKSIQSITKSSS